MKKTLHVNSILILGIAILLTCGCKKDDSNGPSSKLEAHNFSASTWLYSAPEYYIELAVPELTSSNISSAAVMVYFSTDNGVSWTALPFTQYNSPYNYFMNFTTQAGKVRVTWIYDTSFSSGNNPNTFYSTTVQLKVSVIS
jgi:hypothetical protein